MTAESTLFRSVAKMHRQLEASRKSAPITNDIFHSKGKNEII